VARCDAGDLKVHAPATVGVGAHGADLVARGSDVEGVTSLMAVDAISQMSSVAGASDWESVRDTLSILIAVVNEDVHRR
jgi:hypothetical protein